MENQENQLRSVLEKLSVKQIEQALVFLENDELNPPKNLRHLNEEDWHVISEILVLLKLEKASSPLQ